MKKRNMDRFQVGQVVSSLQGKDKGGYYVVVKKDIKSLYVANGTKWTIEDPKKKNPFHLQVTGTFILNDQTLSIEETQFCNAEIVQTLNAFENR